MLWLGVGPPWLQLVLRLPPTAPISLEPTLGSTVLWPLLPPEPCLILGGPRLPLLPEPWLTLGGTRASVTLWAVSDSGGMRASVTPWAVPDSREACAGQAQFSFKTAEPNRRTLYLSLTRSFTDTGSVSFCPAPNERHLLPLPGADGVFIRI